MNEHPRDEPSQNLYIGITDDDWFAVVSRIPDIDEVNFWQYSWKINKKINFELLR